GERRQAVPARVLSARGDAARAAGAVGGAVAARRGRCGRLAAQPDVRPRRPDDRGGDPQPGAEPAADRILYFDREAAAAPEPLSGSASPAMHSATRAAPNTAMKIKNSGSAPG